MKTAIIKYFACILAFGAAYFNAAFAAASEPRTNEQSGIYIDKITVSELQKIYEKNNYTQFIPRDTWQVPAIFLKRLPSDFAELEDENLRNQLFIQILSPLALKVNEDILAERSRLEQLTKHFEATHKLSKEQEAWLETTAEKYNVFTRFNGYRRYKLLLSKLIKKIDAVPPSVMIAAAGIETDWGKSRLTKEGNSLYKEVVWHSNDGLLPEDEKEDKTYRIKIFPSLYDAMKSFALKINSSINFENTRTLREDLRQRHKLSDGRTMASSFVLLSPEPNYIGLLDYTITFYELINVDASKLIYDLPLPPG